jgi:hypothetical protein
MGALLIEIFDFHAVISTPHDEILMTARGSICIRCVMSSGGHN